jgi:uncharacterized Zn-binding protein involved in type VI secretion
MLRLSHVLHCIPPVLLSLSSAPLGCGGSTPPPETPEVEPVKIAEPEQTKAPPEPTCEEALSQKSAKAVSLCQERCDSGDAGVCLAIADLHLAGAAGGTPDAASGASYFEKACDKGSDEACFRGSEALRQADKGRADRLLEKGCREEPKTEFAFKSCHALGETRASGPSVEDQKAALAFFEKSCSRGHKPSCSEKRRAKDAIDAATAPVEFEGKLVSRTGKALKVRLNAGASPTPGALAEVLRYFESKPGEASPLGVLGGLLGGTISGWVVIAGAKVDKVDNDTVTLTISEERSTIMINGKKVNHFAPGARMKLAVARSPKP